MKAPKNTRQPGGGTTTGRPLVLPKCVKVTDADVLAIRQSNEPAEVLAQRYDITAKYVLDLRSRRKRRLDPPAPEAAATVEKPPGVETAPLFGSMRYGRYLPNDSAIARAYAQRSA